jgi:Ser/Thr protein kinase RdoA (MazF antagonist)
MLRGVQSAAPDAAAVLAAFGLPGDVLAYEDVAGGWSNRVLRLTTTDGSWAVKELRNAWGEPRWRDWLDEGVRLESAAIAAGVAAPAPLLALSGDVVVEVALADGSGRAPVRVHPWVPADVVAREPVDGALAAWVGRTLAAVHRLALRPLRPDLYQGRVGLTTAEVWPALVARSTAAAAPWAGLLADAEPLARRASALLVPWDLDDAVLTHGDVDQKNLLVSADGPLLVDWDVVLPAVPSHDLAHAALTMASWRSPAVARAVLDGYAGRAGAAPGLRPADLGPALASRLGWIRFSVDRALDAGPPYDLDLAALLQDLARRIDVAEQLDDWLHAAGTP